MSEATPLTQGVLQNQKQGANVRFFSQAKPSVQSLGVYFEKVQVAGKRTTKNKSSMVINI